MKTSLKLLFSLLTLAINTGASEAAEPKYRSPTDEMGAVIYNLRSYGDTPCGIYQDSMRVDRETLRVIRLPFSQVTMAIYARERHPDTAVSWYDFENSKPDEIAFWADVLSVACRRQPEMTVAQAALYVAENRFVLK